MKTHDEINEGILAHVDAIGGGYVWDAECFAVNLLDVSVSEGDAAYLRDLHGVQQIALSAAHLSYQALESVARIPGLQSLVLGDVNLSESQLTLLRQLCPEILLISDDT